MRDTPSCRHAAAVAAANAVPPRPGYSVTGTGPTVLLLHASLGSKAQWRALTERLSSRFRVIAVDLWAYGDNADWPAPTPFSLDDELQVVAECLERLMRLRDPVHVVGHSYGGLVALRLAASKVRRVASLTLYEPVVARLLNAHDRAPFEQLGRHATRLICDGATRDAARAFVDFWSGAGCYESLPLERQRALAKRIGKIPLDFTAALGWPPDGRALQALDVPTMLLVGNRGPALVRRIVDRLAHLLPDARVTSFDAGHMGPVTHPEHVNPWIEAFIDRCTMSASGPLEHALQRAPWRSQGASPAM